MPSSAADEVISEYETFVAALDAASRAGSALAQMVGLSGMLSRKLMSLASPAASDSPRLELETESGSAFRSMRASLGEGFACRLKVDGPMSSALSSWYRRLQQRWPSD